MIVVALTGLVLPSEHLKKDWRQAGVAVADPAVAF
jgi:hypothetical protein